MRQLHCLTLKKLCILYTFLLLGSVVDSSIGCPRYAENIFYVTGSRNYYLTHNFSVHTGIFKEHLRVRKHGIKFQTCFQSISVRKLQGCA